jgi:hypothetical protein
VPRPQRHHLRRPLPPGRLRRPTHRYCESVAHRIYPAAAYQSIDVVRSRGRGACPAGGVPVTDAARYPAARTDAA